MSLESELGIDLSGVNIDQAAAEIAAPLAVPPGYYHAVLCGVRAGVANSGTPFRELTFEILAGPFDGKEVEHTLYLPHAGQEEAKKKKSINQYAIYAHRLGLKEKIPGTGGLKDIPGRGDFGDCAGAACVIRVINEEEEFVYQKGPKAGQRGKATRVRLDYEGVLEVGDRRAEGVVLAPPEVVKLRAAAAKSKAAEKAGPTNAQFGNI